MNSYLYIQNAGLECTNVAIWLKRQGECIRSRLDVIPGLAPGGTAAYDLNDVVGPVWTGDAWIQASQPLAITADNWSDDILTTHQGRSIGLSDDASGPSPASQMNYGSLIYRDSHGWNTHVQVSNLDRDQPATVQVTLLDASGAVIVDRSDSVCPLGTQSFSLSPIDDRSGRPVGSVRVASVGESPSPIASTVELIQFDGPAQTRLYEGLSYNLLPGSQIEGADRIALGPILKAAQSTEFTSKIIVTNWNTTPGSTSLALDLYDANGLLDTISREIDPGETLRIDVGSESVIGAGWSGSAMLQATYSTQAGVPLLSAVVVGSLATDTTSVGDETQVHAGRPLIETLPPGTPGDANDDGETDAGDISAVVLEIFDGDGNDRRDTLGGSFTGNPIGCDANNDGRVDAGDISCTVLLIFNGPGACGGNGSTAGSNPRTSPGGPRLRIPMQAPATGGSSVTAPIEFTSHDYDISSLIFSIDYDQTRLAFDPTDSNGDGIPDAVDFNIPEAFSASITFDGNDEDGELDLLIADVFPPLGSLLDGMLATITLNVSDTPPDTVEAPVNFSQAPAASFGSTSGHSVPGMTVDGSVLIRGHTYTSFLPFIVTGRSDHE